VYGCDFDEINNEELVTGIMIEAAKISGATIENVSAKKFQPQGLTVLILISESHLSFHSYPESQMCMIDIFTCGDHTFPEKGVEYILSKLKHEHFECNIIERGKLF
jgi:S-adenosylmethionine decarboxylase